MFSLQTYDGVNGYGVDDFEVSGLFKKLKKIGRKIDPIQVTKKSFKETKRAINNPAVKKAAAVVASGAAIYFSGGAATPAVLAAWKMDADKRAAKKAAKAGAATGTQPPQYVVDELERGSGYPLDTAPLDSFGPSSGGGGGGAPLSLGGGNSKVLLVGAAAVAAVVLFGKRKGA